MPRPASPVFPPSPFSREVLQLRNQVANSGAERDELFSARAEHEQLVLQLAGTNASALAAQLQSARPKLNSSVTARLKHASIIPVCDPDRDLTKLFSSFHARRVSWLRSHDSQILRKNSRRKPGSHTA